MLDFLFYPFTLIQSLWNYLQLKLILWAYSTQIVFSTAWEDPRSDQVCLDLKEDEDVCMIITSAGCNALSLALDGAKHVYCVDKNPAQNAILELKMAAVKELEFDEFWQLFGEGFLQDFTKKHYRNLRQHLSPSSRAFWDSHSHYFDGQGWFRPSFYFYGCSGVLACAVIFYLKLIPGLYPAVLSLFECSTLEEQKHIYETQIRSKLFHPILMWILSQKMTLALLNGVPKAQRDLLAEESGSATIAEFMQKSLEYVMTELPMKENYFWKVYLTGKYTKDCCPAYLTKEGFMKLKSGYVDRISVHTMYVTEFLDMKEEKKNDEEEEMKNDEKNREISTEGDITRFFLLDHMDWMAQAPKLLEEEWRAIFRRACKHRARFLWRSASLKAEFVGNTPVDYMGKTCLLKDVLQYRDDLAEAGHKIDRVHTYTSFFVADLK